MDLSRLKSVFSEKRLLEPLKVGPTGLERPTRGVTAQNNPGLPVKATATETTAEAKAIARATATKPQKVPRRLTHSVRLAALSLPPFLHTKETHTAVRPEKGRLGHNPQNGRPTDSRTG